MDKPRLQGDPLRRVIRGPHGTWFELQRRSETIVYSQNKDDALAEYKYQCLHALKVIPSGPGWCDLDSIAE